MYSIYNGMIIPMCATWEYLYVCHNGIPIWASRGIMSLSVSRGNIYMGATTIYLYGAMREYLHGRHEGLFIWVSRWNIYIGAIREYLHGCHDGISIWVS